MSTNYVILVDIDEKTYVDGHYRDEQMAIDVFEHWARTYPNLEFELAELIAGYSPIPDELFMAKNKVKDNVYIINRMKIVEETIDGEVIIINLDKGHYFSLNGIGADIWENIRSCTPISEIIANIKISYSDPKNSIEDSINSLLINLLAEELIIETDQNNIELNSLPNIAIENDKKMSFIEPILEKYTDMEDLLLLDPIHDVDEQGWPKMPKVLD